jgi:signal peptidase I
MPVAVMQALVPSGALRRASRAFWVVVLPVVLAGLVIRYLVPVTGTGVRGAVAVFGHRYTLLFGLALYLVFSATARHWIPRPAADTARLAPWGRELLVLGALLAAALVVALAFREYVAKPYRVIGPSMLPTLEPEDLVAGRTRPYARALPQRGDIVVFSGAAVAVPGLPEILIKRVIGLPGDRIAMRGGTPVINGLPLPTCDVGGYVHPFPDPGDPGLLGRLRIEFVDDHAYLVVHSQAPSFSDTYTVKPGEVFVLGDNRGNSADSRSFNGGHGGGVPIDAVEASARWFLFGTRRDASLDMGRLLRPIDRLQVQLRLEGVQTQPVDEAIATCLKDRTKDTRPPPP